MFWKYLIKNDKHKKNISVMAKTKQDEGRKYFINLETGLLSIIAEQVT